MRWLCRWSETDEPPVEVEAWCAREAANVFARRCSWGTVECVPVGRPHLRSVWSVTHTGARRFVSSVRIQSIDFGVTFARTPTTTAHEVIHLDGPTPEQWHAHVARLRWMAEAPYQWPTFYLSPFTAKDIQTALTAAYAEPERYRDPTPDEG